MSDAASDAVRDELQERRVKIKEVQGRFVESLKGYLQLHQTKTKRQRASMKRELTLLAVNLDGWSRKRTGRIIVDSLDLLMKGDELKWADVLCASSDTDDVFSTLKDHSPFKRSDVTVFTLDESGIVLIRGPLKELIRNSSPRTSKHGTCLLVTPKTKKAKILPAII